MPLPSPTADLRGGLAALRRRIRAFFAVSGVARVVVALLLALGLFYAADLFLDLPLGVRRFVRLGVLDRHPDLSPLLWLPLTTLLGLCAFYLTRGARGGAAFVAFLFAGLAGLLASILWRACAPMSARLSDAELAALVEQRQKNLGDRLESALDFERELGAVEGGGSGRGESPAMMRSVLEQAQADTRAVAFGRVVSGRASLAWLGTAALTLVGAGAALGLSPAKAGLFARRSLLLEDVPWPRASTLWAALVGEDGRVTRWPPETPLQVAVGRSLVVQAWAEGEPVDEAVLLDQAEGQQPLPRRMFPVAGRAGLYAVELVNVRQGFAFVLQGGDDRDEVPVYRVEVTVPPALLEIAASLVFPPYLARAPERVEGGNLSVPQGTQITLLFVPSEPLAELRALAGEQVLAGERVVADGAGEAWRVTLTAERSLRFRLLLRAPDGRENDAAADSYDLTVLEDRPPKLEWLWPRGVTEVTPGGRVPLLVRTSDDHAVTGLTLELRVGAEGPVSEAVLTPHTPQAPAGFVESPGAGAGSTRSLAANDGPDGRSEILSYVPLELSWLAPEGGLPAPSTVSVRVAAVDSKGQRRESAWQVLEVYAPAELERTLATRRSGVKSAVQSLEAEQLARLAQVTELRQGPVGESERDLLKSVEFAQAKLEQHADGAVRDYLDIFAHFVLDRLGAENPNERILATFDRHHRASYGRVVAERDAAGRGDASRRAEDGVFPYALFEGVVEAWRERRLIDSGLLERMLAVLDAGLTTAARRAPEAHRAATRASSGGAAEIEALEAAQRAHLDALRRLLETMASWESLNDVIVRLKRFVEEQKALLDQVDAASADAPKSPPGEGPAVPSPR